MKQSIYFIISLVFLFNTTSVKAHDILPPVADSIANLSKPYFRGNMYRYLREHIVYPNDARTNEIQGGVVVKVQIDEKGKIHNAHIQKSLYPSLDSEALRVVNSMPDWAPAKKNGAPISIWYYVPVMFGLE